MKNTPLEKAIEDLKFMKDKANDAMADIIWGMAITLCEQHIEYEKNEIKGAWHDGSLSSCGSPEGYFDDRYVK